jgi:hypothetical protein
LVLAGQGYHLRRLGLTLPWIEAVQLVEVVYDQWLMWVVREVVGSCGPEVVTHTWALLIQEEGHNLIQEYDHLDRLLGHRA